MQDLQIFMISSNFWMMRGRKGNGDAVGGTYGLLAQFDFRFGREFDFRFGREFAR